MTDDTNNCCAPTSSALQADADAEFLKAARSVKIASADKRTELMKRLKEIKGGFLDMGARQSRFPEDLDSPRRRVRVSPFRISPHAVSNQDYAEFVDDTGYRTIAEITGWSYVFHLFLEQPFATEDHARNLPWWRGVTGACWYAPEGPGSDWAQRANHPVVHIAWYDALAYSVWSGLRLPWECEWEFAARGGLVRKKFPWGNAMMPAGQHMMNIWQGNFPTTNTGEDGWISTAPVDSFAPNGFGLYNMTGNVWEWVRDYYGARSSPGKLAEHDPRGPQDGYARIQRGGSYLCHVSYCDRYHVHSRTRNDLDSSVGNCGFRVAADH